MKEKLKKQYFKISGAIKNKKLKSKDITIISNNCFGGIFYRDNALEYRTPTCGLFFIAEEYIKFIYNLDHYLSIDEIIEIKCEDSKYKDYLSEIQYNGIIGKIEDLEIMFLHYDNIEEAREKWNRRKKRINKEKMIFKFNDQNLCTHAHLQKFNEFDAKNKICFTAKKYDDIDSIQLEQYKNNEYVIKDANERDYKKYFDIYKYIKNI